MENIHEIIDNIIVENNNGEITAKALNLLLHEIAGGESITIKMPDTVVYSEYYDNYCFQIKDDEIINHNKKVYDKLISNFNNIDVNKVKLFIKPEVHTKYYWWIDGDFEYNENCQSIEKINICDMDTAYQLTNGLNYYEHDLSKLRENIGNVAFYISTYTYYFILFPNGDISYNMSDEYLNGDNT